MMPPAIYIRLLPKQNAKSLSELVTTELWINLAEWTSSWFSYFLLHCTMTQLTGSSAIKPKKLISSPAHFKGPETSSPVGLVCPEVWLTPAALQPFRLVEGVWQMDGQWVKMTQKERSPALCSHSSGGKHGVMSQLEVEDAEQFRESALCSFYFFFLSWSWHVKKNVDSILRKFLCQRKHFQCHRTSSGEGGGDLRY